MDCDDLWLPEKLEKQVAFMQQHSVPFCFSSYHIVDSVGSLKREVIYEARQGDLFNLITHNYTLGILTVLMCRDFLLKTGMRFDSQSHYYGDCIFFSLIASRYPIGCLAEVLAHYRHHGGTLSFQLDEKRYEDELAVLQRRIREDFPVPRDRLMLKSIQRSYDSWRIKSYLLRNELRSARRVLRCYFIHDAKFFLCYWLTWLPARIVKQVLAKYLR